MSIIAPNIEKQFAQGANFLALGKEEGLKVEGTGLLWQKQNELFANIERSQDDLSREELLNIVKRLFEHSISDGLKIAEGLHLTPAEVLACLNRPQFFIKHQRFANSLKLELKGKLDKTRNRQAAEEIIENYENFGQEFEDGNYYELLEAHPEAQASSKDGQELLQKTDDIYAEFLKLREVKEKEIINQRSPGERLAERHLIKAERALEHKYYSGNILRAVFEFIKQNEEAWLKKRVEIEFKKSLALQQEYQDFERYYKFLSKEWVSAEKICLDFLEEKGIGSRDREMFLEADLIDKSLVEKLQNILELDKRLLKQAEYKLESGFFKVQNRIAKNQLITELEGSLKTHLKGGTRVVYDDKEDKYAVAAEAGVELEKQEALSKDREIKIEKYDWVDSLTEINGQLVYRAKRGNKYFVVQGQEKSEEYDGVGSLTEINGQLVYEAKRGNKYFVVQGQEKSEEYDWVGSLTEINGQLVYEAKRGNKYFVVQGQEMLEEYQKIKVLKNKYIFWGCDGKKLKIREIRKQKLDKQLTNQEQAKLELLNLVNTPELASIKKYFDGQAKKYKKKLKDKIKTKIEHSAFVAGQITAMIKESPSLFLDTISGKKDKLNYLMVKRLINKIFPEMLVEEKKAWYRGFGGYAGLELTNEGEPKLSPENFLSSSDFSFMEGGDPSLDENEIVLEFRQPLDELVATGIFGRYNSGSKVWEKLDFALNAELAEPIDELTACAPRIKGLERINLPKTLNSRIIKERVKGTDLNGEEVALQTEIDSLGQGMAKTKKGVGKVVYSLAVSKIPQTMIKVASGEYAKYKKEFIRSFGSDLVQEVAELPEECEIFLDSIKEKSPKEQVVLIERWVRDMCYYDNKNREVMALKRGKGLEEKMFVMEQRLDELKAKNLDLAEKFKNKKYAGVCADFTIITAALLRKAGFLSGVVSGFMPKGKTVKIKDAHGVAFVVWPDENNRNKIFKVDGTPDGLAGISTSSLAEKEQMAQAEIEKIKEEAEARLHEIMQILANQNPKEIKKLTNGELESVLNNILRYEVKMPHFQIINRVLDAYWYTPAKDGDLKERKDFFGEEIKKQRSEISKKQEIIDAPAGKYLFEIISSFVERFIKGRKAGNLEESFDLIEGIFENVEQDLSPVEKRALAAVVTYLRAKKVLG